MNKSRELDALYFLNKIINITRESEGK